jgi:HPt (histidine-containing phosphotransfer) domain-containing protein
MPEMDGFEATGHIRDPGSRVRDHRVPIIAMTAHAMQGDRQRCLDAGMDDYLTKPVSPQALADVLDRWLPREDVSSTTLQPGAPDGTGVGGPAHVAMHEVHDTEPIVFDRAGMLERLMGDEDLARSVSQGFLEDAPRQIDALRDFLAAGDVAGAVRQVHTLKGASAAVGAEALRSVALRMETAGRAADLGALQEELPALETEFGRVARAMEDSGGGTQTTDGSG